MLRLLRLPSVVVESTFGARNPTPGDDHVRRHRGGELLARRVVRARRNRVPFERNKVRYGVLPRRREWVGDEPTRETDDDARTRRRGDEERKETSDAVFTADVLRRLELRVVLARGVVLMG